MRLTTLASVLLLAAAATISSDAQSGPVQIKSRTSVNTNFGKLPLTFEGNRGQADSQVKFITRAPGYSASLTSDGMVLSLRARQSTVGQTTTESVSAGQPTHTTLQFRLLGAAKNPAILGEDPQLGRVNYFLGNDPAKWHTNVPTFAHIRYKNIYPGIDLVYYGSHRQLEYDFAVAPGADPGRIQFEILGATRIHIDAQGNLVLEIGAGELHFQSPMVYQESTGRRVAVAGGYVVDDATHVGFHVAAYDRSKPLVIDPVLIYSTYLGGSGDEQPAGVAVDSAGNTYLAGSTNSADFPLSTLGSLPAGVPHVFLAKLDATGSNLLYTDYLGGNNEDDGYALALDAANDVYITGSTASSDFPVVDPFQGTYPGGFNAFLTKISADGSSLLYSSYLGGNGSDLPSSIAIDSAGDMVIGGYTSSTNFPVANAYQPTVSANQGGMYGNYGFLTKFNPDGASLIYSTYFAGNSNVPYNCGGTPCWPQPFNTINGMVVDAAGNAYVAGVTNTYNFPVTAGAYLTSDSTQLDGTVGFVSKFSDSGSLQYSTYFYEASGLLTNINAIAVDSSGSAYIAGVALSDGTFPITSTSICDPSVYGWGCNYAFATKFDPAGSTLLYSTFLGPNNNATPRAIVLNGNDDAYVLASTGTNSFSTVNGIESFTSGNDLLLVELDASASTQLFATYLGGSGDDEPAGMALDANDNLYLAGATNSSDFPVTQAGFQSALGGGTDGFVLKIGPSPAPAVAVSPSLLQYGVQPLGSTSSPQTALLRNMGSSALTISSVTTTGDFAETDDCGGTVPAAGSCTLSLTFTPTAAGTRTGSAVIQDDADGSPHIIKLTGSGPVPAVTLTPASLVFSSQPLGTSSSVQTVTLASTGSTTLNLGSLQVTGDFAQTNNCPATLAPGSNCTINVTFAPTAAGNRSGTLAIIDDAQDSPQTVILTGAGSDFSLASSPDSATSKAGSTATYTLSIAAVGGTFANAVQLNCSGAPAKAACSLSQSSVTPGGNSATATLTVTTTASVARAFPARALHDGPTYAVWLQLSGMGLFGMLFPAFRRRRKKFAVAGLLGLLTLALMFMPACAGGTGISSTPTQGTPPGTYTVMVTGTSGTLQHSLPLTLVVQ